MNLIHSGKVRDVYDAGDGHLLMVTSDRISAFDVVLDEPIPDKGRVLTALTAFWLERIADIAPSHLVRIVDEGEAAGRAMVVRRAEMLPIECIVRGYLSGSAWKEYQRTGTVHGQPMPAGMQQSDRLPEPVFTPSTKAEVGLHDENITVEQAIAIVGRDVADEAGLISLAAYTRAAADAAEHGIVIADTKFELGWIDGKLSICDEVLTPDSSRFWEAADWRPGTIPPSFDKQPVRDWLEGTGWDKTPPPPPLPDEVVRATSTRYVAAYERLTGKRLADWPGADDRPATTGRACKGDGVSTFPVLVEVTLRPDVADPQGATIERALPALGYDQVAGVRVGKAIRFTIEAPDEATARVRVEDLCRRFLTNPVIEDATITFDIPMMKVGVVVFPGSNCEHDVVEALTLLGGDAQLVWHGERSLGDVDAVVLPGRLRPWRLPPARRHRPLQPGHGRGRRIRRTPAGPWSASATASRCSPKPDSCPVRSRRTGASSSCAARWTCGGERRISAHQPCHRGRRPPPADQPLRGELHLFPEVLAQLRGRRPHHPAISRQPQRVGRRHRRRVLATPERLSGSMPHPERACDALLGSADGKPLLASLLDAVGYPSTGRKKRSRRSPDAVRPPVGVRSEPAPLPTRRPA